VGKYYTGDQILEVIIETKPELITADRDMALLDVSLLTFPLCLRPWEQGDYFFPLGMTHRKKLSDFLIDQKVSTLDKENQWVLLSNDQIAWVVGRRIDHRFRITERTEMVLKLIWHEKPV
jgi:tRNA(Ile)-lysidine synthase